MKTAQFFRNTARLIRLVDRKAWKYRRTGPYGIGVMYFYFAFAVVFSVGLKSVQKLMVGKKFRPPVL